MSTTTERELLENAARAAGHGWRWFGADFCIDKDVSKCTYRPWNPRDDSTDALELAVKLRLLILPSRDGKSVIVDSYSALDAVEESTGNDPLAATRLAVTRAAAKIQLAKGGV